MIYFNPLTALSPLEICSAFNDAFSDYTVPIQLTLPLLEQKMQGENIRLACSMGAFEGPRLAGFALHGVDAWPAPSVLYNGGTGVVPAYRGQRLVQRMYAHFLPQYRQMGVQRILLEVISTNEKAIKAYTATGFRQTRLFHCYKGQPALQKIRRDIAVRRVAAPDWPLLAAFLDQPPSWSNNIAAVQREGMHTVTWAAYEKEEIVGFISVYTGNKRIRLLGVDPARRRQGIGSALLQHVTEELQGPFSIINITDDNPDMQQFLLQAGFTYTLSQYEMELPVS